jgi:hypothetical protein
VLTILPETSKSVGMTKATKQPAKHSAGHHPVESHIHVIRGDKVMLDTDLAGLYQVEPRALIQAVRRNTDRFPSDFMFQLSHAEAAEMRSQSVISLKRPRRRNLWVTDAVQWAPEARLAQPANSMWDSAASAFSCS